MNPTNSSQGGDELGPVGSGTPQTSPPQDHQSAAANVIRSQIDALYGGRPAAERELDYSRENAAGAVVTPALTAQPAQAQPQAAQTPFTQQQAQPVQAEIQDTNPYQRTHSEHPQPQAEQWKQYHSAWQNYYQKYYESYYQQHHAQTAAAQAQIAEAQLRNQAVSQIANGTQNSSKDGYFADRVQAEQTNQSYNDSNNDIDKDEALFELRQKLLGKVRGQAQKIRGSKHFVPIVAALSVVLIFVFLQYNRVFIATVNAYVSPGSIDTQNIVIDPSADSAVSADPRLIIPKINVDVPAIYGITPDHDSQMAAMEKGVAHFSIPGANSKPGEVGNTVLSGHSSNDLFDSGDYKFIFAQLEKLKTGDTIYANYEGVRYTYVITKMEVVKPTQVSALVYPTDKPMLTLITCTPLGTALNRLLVTAEQISPDPSKAASAPAGSGQESDDSADIPGSSPTLLERLFGAR